MAQQTFNTVQMPDPDLNRIQSNISKVLNSPSISPVTQVKSSKYSINTSDDIVVYDTTQISGVSSSSPLSLILPDVAKSNGFLFVFKKLDSTSNPVNFISSGKNKQGNQPTIEAQPSPYQNTSSYGTGTLFCDGSNWWIT